MNAPERDNEEPRRATIRRQVSHLSPSVTLIENDARCYWQVLSGTVTPVTRFPTKYIPRLWRCLLIRPETERKKYCLLKPDQKWCDKSDKKDKECRNT